MAPPKQTCMLFQNDVLIDFSCYGSNLNLQVCSGTRNNSPPNEQSCTTETVSFNDVLLMFERGRIVGLREAGLSYREVASRVQRNSSTIMRVSKQWTDEGRTARKSGGGSRNVTSARDDRRLRGLRARIPLCRIPLTQNHCRLRLQWANVHRSWRADWQQVVFSDESRFNLWHHDGRIRVRLYAGERHIPECIINHHSGRTPGVMVWGVIAYHGRSQLLRIVGILNSTRYINEVLQPQAIPFLQGLPGAVFQQDNARSHVAKTVKSYLDSQQVQLLP
ncbi:transposable element Tc1 transposase [Trichonephila clavipes]|nr:transposable element Tc1 transposase [Trichonephila clavipes]